MLILFNLLFLFHIQAADVSGISRAPAVLDSSCDINVTVDDHKPLIEIHKEQCKKVRACMHSALDAEMPALKKLEALACRSELIPVTTAIPKVEVNAALKDENSRKEKVIKVDDKNEIFVPSATKEK